MNIQTLILFMKRNLIIYISLLLFSKPIFSQSINLNQKKIKKYVYNNNGYSQEEKNDNPYYYSGSSKLQNENYYDAIIELTKAIELNQNVYDAFREINDTYDKIEHAIGEKRYRIGIQEENLESQNLKKEIDGELQKLETNREETYKNILSICNKYINLYPANADGYLLRGWVKKIIKIPSSAIVDYTKAIELNPNYAEAYYFRAEAEADMSFASRVDRSKSFKLGFKGGYDWTNEKEILKDDNFYNSGMAKFGFGDIKGSIIDFTNAILQNPTNSESYTQRGVSKFWIYDFRGAIVDLTKAIELNPKNGLAYLFRGMSNYYSNNYLIATNDFTKAIDLIPNEKAMAYFGRSCSKYSLGDSTTSIIDKNKAIEADSTIPFFYQGIEIRKKLNEGIKSYPNDIALYLKMGISYENSTGYHVFALSNFNKAIELNPNNANSYFLRGETKLKTKDYFGAIEDITRALDLNLVDSNSYLLRGQAEIEIKDYDAAIADLSNAINLTSSKAEVYFLRGLAIIEKNKYKSKIDYDKSFDDFSKAIEINPNNTDYYIEKIYKRSEKHNRDYVYDFTKLIDLLPNNGNLYFVRGWRKWKNGDKSGACNDWKEAERLGDKRAEDTIKKECE